MKNIKKTDIIVICLLILLDMVSMIISSLLAFFLRYRGVGFTLPHETFYMSRMIFPMFLAIVWYDALGGGEKDFLKRGYLIELTSVAKLSIGLFAFLSAWIYWFRYESNYSRLVLGGSILINGLLAYILRTIGKTLLAYFYRKTDYSEKVLIISNLRNIWEISEKINSDKRREYTPIGICLLDVDKEGESINGLPVVAKASNVGEFMKTSPVDSLFIACDDANERVIKRLMNRAFIMGLKCYYRIETIGQKGVLWHTELFADIPTIMYDTLGFDYRKRAVKKVMDYSIGLFGSLITTLLLPFVAIAIKIDSKGPVFFKQKRVGKNGRVFTMYKFRSMCENAEELKADLDDKNEMKGPMFKVDNDPRITKVGNFLRKTSIDELPQFYNVLLGNMSVIGTRPPTVEEFEQYSYNYVKRLCTAPGITGLWQVSGRSEITDFDEVVGLDIEYINNWSLAGDIKILLKTIKIVILGRGAK